MDRQWLENRKKTLAVEAKDKRAEIVEKIMRASFLNEQDKKDIVSILDNESGSSYSMFDMNATEKVYANHMNGKDPSYEYFEIMKFINSLNVDSYRSILYRINGGLERFLDSKIMAFDGDIIITDPCYIIRAEHHGTQPITDDDWEACNYGDDMDALGIHQYMTRDTLYGDWGCTIYNTDTGESMGDFCADAGLVSVFLLDEVLKYNPGFDYHKEKEWTTALISDFKGTVQFVVEHQEGVYEDTTEYHKAGDKWEDCSVHVVGHGINKKTGDPINFRSTQTGL